MGKLHILILVVLYVCFTFAIEDQDLSHCFIDRWEFQKICKFTFDCATNWDWRPTSKVGVTFNPQHVESGDIIFVREPDKFFKNVYPYIKNKFIIITHGIAYDAFKKSYLKYLELDNVIAWFGAHS